MELSKRLQKKISSNKGANISNSDLKNELNEFASEWFNKFSKNLINYGIESDVVIKYDGSFKKILLLSGGNNRKSSYEKYFGAVNKSFREEIVIFLQTEAQNIEEHTASEFSSDVAKILEKVPDKDENEYLTEALGCWKNGYLKAATILFWCCAIDRIHKVIEQQGFPKFNQASDSIKKQTTGRFKHVSKNFTIHSKSDLQMVFDKDLLWVVEGMQLVDSNQMTRLSSCFSMRCHAGHPGAAPITEYNVISCFSDIVEIVLNNPKFLLATPEAT